MVLSHFLPLLSLIGKAGQLEHPHWHFERLGEEVLQAADGPAERHLPAVDGVCVGEIILDSYFDHACAFLDFGHLHFLLYNRLDLFLLYVKIWLLST